jgi:hypothetical protein
VGAVKVRIHDQALPADRRARFFKIDPHDDHDPVPDLVCQNGEPPGVFLPRGDVMDRAGAENEQETLVVGEDEPVNLPAGMGHKLGLGLGFWQRLQEGRRGGQGAGFDDIDVGGSLHEGPAWGGRPRRIKFLLCAKNWAKKRPVAYP